MIDLSVIVVNWNTCEFLRGCLASVLAESAELALELLVIDNDSQDDSLNMLATEFPQATVIANTANVGFAAANNQGIALATGRHVVLLNPDTKVVDKALAKMVTYLDQHPSVGVVGPKLMLPDGTIQGGAAGHDPSPGTVFAYALVLHSLFPHRVRGLWLAKENYQAAENDVDWVAGACLMVRAPVIQQVGPMDTSFFMYAEDIEWCYRIKKAGWRIVCLSSTSVIHHIGGSTRQKGYGFVRQNIRGLDTYYRSRYSSILRAILHFWGGFGFLLRTTIYQILSWIRHDKKCTESRLIMWECAKSSFDCLLNSFKT
jgi:GT2 family glycosyltransferase